MPPGYFSIRSEDDTLDALDSLPEPQPGEPIVSPEPSSPTPRLRRDAQSLQRWLDLSA